MPNQNTKTMNMEQFKAALAVHEAMLNLGHASADMVTESIRKASGTNVTVASVYNILTQLSCLGIYRHRMSANNKMYFDVNTFRHIHIYDCENHSYRDLIDEELMGLIESHLGRKRFRGFRIEDIDIQLVARPTRRKLPAKRD